jgi:hypothetical protein
VVVARAVTSTSCSSQNLRCVLLNFCTGRRCRRRQSSSGRRRVRPISMSGEGSAYA